MNNNKLPTLYQEYIHKSRYARWLWDKNRRETWEETVARYFDFFESHLKEKHKYTVPKELREKLETAVLSLKVMPSMRCLMTAGEALERENVAAYNCSYTPIDTARSFDEILYILMNGTGVGFSVETRYINQLPVIAEDFEQSDTTIHVADSKLGWAKAYKELVHLLYGGQIPKWDLSKVRPAGAPLKTFGGRASGPGPLEDLFKFTVRMFQNAAGRKLNSREAADLVCKIASIVVVGGVRRSALICLSDLNDDLMREYKSGQWWENNPQRRLANISYVAENKPDTGIFLKEWLALFNSKSGERGIFSRSAAQKQAAKIGRETDVEFGTNPCSEIILRPREFCNLSEIIARQNDNLDSLKEKAELATILGTWQSTLTDFRYISKRWKENCDDERLLGVSITGFVDAPVLIGKNKEDIMDELKTYCRKVNKKHAETIGIKPSASITCVKPSGTVSQLVDSGSGMHPRHSPYYIRTVRADIKDPLCKFMMEAGFPWEAEIMQPDSTAVFSFPTKSPSKSIFRKDLGAIEHLELWKSVQDHWTEHKPSITVSVKDNEWVEVAAWVFKNFDSISGISFLPFADHIYQQAPYQDITEEQYKILSDKMPKEVDWDKLSEFEKTDMTTASQELACSAGGCEIVDLVGVIS